MSSTYEIVKQGTDITSATEVLVPLRDVAGLSCDEFADFFSIGADNAYKNAQTLLGSAGAASVAVREAASNPGKLYRIVEGGVTQIDGTDGLVRGAVWKSGADGTGMKEMAKFAEVGQAAKVASTFVSQGMLIYIACELNDIKRGIADIQNELFEAEVSRMKGCIRFAGTALRYYRQRGEKDIIVNAIQSIETEVDPLLDAIMRQVRRLPPKTSFLKVDKEELKASYDAALSALLCLLKGMLVLSILYSVSDPDFGKEEFVRLIDSVIGNNAIINWLNKAGQSLSLNGYGDKYRERIESLVKSLNVQKRVLSAQSVGLLLTGQQMAKLGSEGTGAPDHCQKCRRERVGV